MQLMIWILHSCPWNINHHPFGWISSTWLVTCVWSTWYIALASFMKSQFFMFLLSCMLSILCIFPSFTPLSITINHVVDFICVMYVNNMVQFHPYSQFIHVLKVHQIHRTMLMDEIDHTWNIAPWKKHDNKCICVYAWIWPRRSMQDKIWHG
jgi:hypothetical protein